MFSMPTWTDMGEMKKRKKERRKEGGGTRKLEIGPLFSCGSMSMPSKEKKEKEGKKGGETSTTPRNFTHFCQVRGEGGGRENSLLNSSRRKKKKRE